MYDFRMYSSYPNYFKGNNYGTTEFWVEEYWAATKILELEQKYPGIDFTGLIDDNYKTKIVSYLQESNHLDLSNITKFAELSEIESKDYRKFINVSTSHAPSRFIAKEYIHSIGDKFGIITIDAHLDMFNRDFIHNAWITNDIASFTTVIGGWADVMDDIQLAKSVLAFYEPNITDLSFNSNFIKWIADRKIYLTIDLDFFHSSQSKFMGYSNYWHRDKIIGHSMNFEQILEERIIKTKVKNSRMAGYLLGIFHELESFVKMKKRSLKLQSGEIEKLLELIVSIFKSNSATLLCVDFVEYSPICDYRQLTLKELERKYSKFYDIISSVREK